MTLPHGKRGQAVALGLLLAMLSLVWIGVVAPLADLYQERALALQARQGLAAQMRGLAASLPGLRAAATAEPDRRRSTSLGLTGATDALAAANLQTLVGQIASGSGITISSIDTIIPQNSPWGRRIGVSLRINGSYRSIVIFLHRILSAQPKMVVDDLELHNTTAAGATDQSLDGSVSVSGFRVSGHSS
jgi:general secretion pathway protein M